MNAIASANSIVISSMAQLESLDLETAMMAVQSQRASLLEDQLKGQLQEVQQRNAQIGKLNDALASARELSAQFSDKDGSTKKMSDLLKSQKKDYAKTPEGKADIESLKTSWQAKIQAQYPDEKIKFHKDNAFSMSSSSIFPVKVGEPFEIPDNRTAAGKLVEKLQTACGAANITLEVENKGQLEKTIENLKSMIDSQSNSQQMDMLRLQSLSNKRNEAFELMTNFIKKMQDSRSSIVANLR